MTNTCKRLFILGAGFSKAAGMPLATELTRKLIHQARLGGNDDQGRYLRRLRRRLARADSGAAHLNFEQLFDYAKLDAELSKMAQQRCRVGREYGTTPHGEVEMIECVLRRLHESLVALILREQKRASVEPIERFVRRIAPGDGIITFNYDTLVEQALDKCGMPWNYGLHDQKGDPRQAVVLKMHGSINWVCTPRKQRMPGSFTMLFEKSDANARDDTDVPLEETEYHTRLWRVPLDKIATVDRMCTGLSTMLVWHGIAGFGSFKPLHQLPGSGLTWEHARRAIGDAQELYIVGFSMSSFDAMARLAFGDAFGERRAKRRRPKCVYLIDPSADELAERYVQVFGPSLSIVKTGAQDVDWSGLLGCGAKGRVRKGGQKPFSVRGARIRACTRGAAPHNRWRGASAPGARPGAAGARPTDRPHRTTNN